MDTFKRMHNDFNYTFQKKLSPKTTVTCPLPIPTGEARSVRTISWSAGTDVVATATLASNYTSTYAQWQTLKDNAQVSPSITAIRFHNPTTFNREVFVWVVME